MILMDIMIVYFGTKLFDKAHLKANLLAYFDLIIATPNCLFCHSDFL